MDSDAYCRRNALPCFLVFLSILMYHLSSIIPKGAFLSSLKIVLPLISLVVCVVKNDFKMKNVEIFFWLVGFIIISSLSMFKTIDAAESLGRLQSLFSLLLGATMISQFCVDEKSIYRIINYCIAGALVYAVFHAVYGIQGMQFNFVVSPATYYLIWHFLFKKKNRLLTGPILLFFLALSILSGLKKATVFPFIFLGTLLLLKYRNDFKKMILVTIAVSSVLGLLFVIAFYNKSLYAILGRRLQGFMSYFTRKGRVDGSTRTRMRLVKEAWIVFIKNPCFGIGLGAFRSANIYATYAHNNFLEILATTGLCGFIAFYWIYLSLFIGLVKQFAKKYNDLLILLISLLIVNLVHDVGTISYYRITLLIPVCLSACYLNIHRLKAPETCKDTKIITESS